MNDSTLSELSPRKETIAYLKMMARLLQKAKPQSSQMACS